MLNKVAIVGCGKIFNRHLEAISSADQYFQLESICDINTHLGSELSSKLNTKFYSDFETMLKQSSANFYVVATPNYLHFDQCTKALNMNKTVLVEKPVSFTTNEINSLINLAHSRNTKAYCVLQVRYNPTLMALKKFVDDGKLGKIRTVNLVLNWQRPEEYFTSWRGDIEKSGGTLYEVGIHYLDVLQYIFGLPQVLASHKTSHKNTFTKVEDTVHSIVKFPNNSTGTIMISLAAEPANIECSISATGSEGYIKISGQALNKFDVYSLSIEKVREEWESIINNSNPSLEPNPYGTYKGSSPNHPILYKEIAAGRGFELQESINSVKLIQDIYEKCTN